MKLLSALSTRPKAPVAKRAKLLTLRSRSGAVLQVQATVQVPSPSLLHMEQIAGLVRVIYLSENIKKTHTDSDTAIEYLQGSCDARAERGKQKLDWMVRERERERELPHFRRVVAGVVWPAQFGDSTINRQFATLPVSPLKSLGTREKTCSFAAALKLMTQTVKYLKRKVCSDII